MSEKREELLESLAVLDSVANDLAIFRNTGIFRSKESPNGESPITGFVNKVCAGDIRSARSCFSLLDAELVSGCLGTCSRRVSGNLLTDAILEAILMSENPFSCLAAQGIMDAPLFNAMQDELSILERLNRISEEDFINILNVFCTPQRDAASVVANAAWSGTGVRHVPKDYLQRRDPLSGMPIRTLRSWDYGEFELTGHWFADEALAEMYKRFIMTEDWGKLTESLWSFHATYGTGDFLRYRNFYFDGKLKPLPELRLNEYIEFPSVDLYAPEEAYSILLNNVISFMRNEGNEPILLTGERGSGKTRLMLRLVEELPELRLVNVTGGYEKLPELFEILSSQPQKFMVLLDNFEESMTKNILNAIIPDNILIAACSEYTNRYVGICSLFTVSAFLFNPHAHRESLKPIFNEILRNNGINCEADIALERCERYLHTDNYTDEINAEYEIDDSICMGDNYADAGNAECAAADTVCMGRNFSDTDSGYADGGNKHANESSRQSSMEGEHTGTKDNHALRRITVSISALMRLSNELRLEQ